MSARKPEPVTLLPVAPLLLEVHSERLPDALRALREAGFLLSNVPGHVHRFRIHDRIEDAKEKSRG